MSIQPQSLPLTPLSFIERIIAEIELTPTQLALARQSYDGVTKVLQKEGSPIRIYNPKNSAQGSMRIGTTVRPPAREEHDLDVLCWLSASGQHWTPHQVYEWVWETIGSDATYRAMREKRSRCIRLTYARQFHLDITPAVPDWQKHTDVLFIPDRERKVWCSTHPIAFADSWFLPISERIPRIEELLFKTANARTFSASVEPLPEYGAFEKTPLQRTVQLVKFDRYRHYENDATHRPSSILLTTLTAEAYSAELLRSAPTLLEFIARVVERIPAGINKEFREGKWKFRVLNPVNPAENFAESWTFEHYQRFKDWHARFLAWFNSLTDHARRGADTLVTQLSQEFGRPRVLKVAQSYGEEVRRQHEARSLRVSSTGRVGAVGALASPTIFYGS